METSFEIFKTFDLPNYSFGRSGLPNRKPKKETIIMVFATNGELGRSEGFVTFLQGEVTRLSDNKMPLSNGREILPIAQSLLQSFNWLDDHITKCISQKGVAIDESANMLSENIKKSIELLKFFLDYLLAVLETNKRRTTKAKTYTEQELRKALKID